MDGMKARIEALRGIPLFQLSWTNGAPERDRRPFDRSEDPQGRGDHGGGHARRLHVRDPGGSASKSPRCPMTVARRSWRSSGRANSWARWRCWTASRAPPRSRPRRRVCCWRSRVRGLHVAAGAATPSCRSELDPRAHAPSARDRRTGSRPVFERVEGRTRRLLRRLATDSVADSPDRLATAPVTHQQLADLVGTSRETVTRVIKELKDEGWLPQEGKRYLVPQDEPSSPSVGVGVTLSSRASDRGELEERLASRSGPPVLRVG